MADRLTIFGGNTLHLSHAVTGVMVDAEVEAAGVGGGMVEGQS